MSITVRAAEPEDSDAIWETMMQPLAQSGTLQIPLSSRETFRKRLAELPAGSHLLVAECDGKVVGNAGLFVETRHVRRKHVASFGISVHDAWQGRGVGTALISAAVDLADRWLNFTRLELTVFTDNTAAIALYKKFGFEIEGTHRAYAFRNGQFADVHSMARLKL